MQPYSHLHNPLPCHKQEPLPPLLPPPLLLVVHFPVEWDLLSHQVEVEVEEVEEVEEEEAEEYQPHQKVEAEVEVEVEVEVEEVLQKDCHLPPED